MRLFRGSALLIAAVLAVKTSSFSIAPLARLHRTPACAVRCTPIALEAEGSAIASSGSGRGSSRGRGGSGSSGGSGSGRGGSRGRGAGRGRGRASNQGRGVGGRGGGGRGGGAEARRERLRTVCAAVRSGEWETVESMLDAAQTPGDTIGSWSAGEWRAMLQASSQVNDWQGSLKLLARLGRPDAEAYAYAIAACGRSNQPREGQELLEVLASARIVPAAKSFNQVISAYARRGEWQPALRLLDATPVDIRTVISYNAALSACSAARPARWSEALELLGRMEADGFAPDVVSYSTAAAACQHAKQWEPAVGILRRLNSSSLLPNAPGEAAPGERGGEGGGGVSTASRKPPAPNVFTYTSAVVALAEAGKWEEAVSTYDSMPAELERNDAIVNAAVAAATTGGDWRTAVRVLEEALAAGVRPRTSSFNIALKCLAAGGEPMRALTVLRSMRSANVRPNLLTYNAALRALERAAL